MKVQYLGSDSTAMYLPNDLDIELWAESPMFYNPTNMDVDAKGRIWVTEAVNYRNYNEGNRARMKHPQGDRVMILEDTDQDGKADKSTVFVQDTDLISPLGIAVMGNRIIVSCSPRMIVYTDSNGDDKPDTKEILLQGFGGLDHDHSLHSVVGGPDGNWYFNVGNAGPHLVQDKSGWTLRAGSMYTGGSPYNTTNQGHMKSDDGEIWTGGLALSINPKGEQLRVYAHNFRNSYEIAMDSYGTMWQNDNDDQMMACRTSYVMESGNAGYFNEDGTRSWQGDRRPGQDIFAAHWHQDDPGVMPAGDNTGAGSPTGIVVNEGDGLGEKYRGLVLSAEAGKNVIYAYKPKPQGAGYELKREDLIRSISAGNINYKWHEDTLNKQMWFRPSDVCIGTDGALYIADWYDPIVGGHMMRELKGYGRIYRITSKNSKTKRPVIDLKSVSGQIEAFQNPAVNVRYQAMEFLKSSGAEHLDEIKKLLSSNNEYIRVRTIWLLAQLGPKGIQEVEQLLSSGPEDAQIVAFRALRKFNNAKTLEYARQKISTSNLSLLREIAFAIKGYPWKQVEDIMDTLLNKYDAKDGWFLAALGIASKHKEDSVYLFSLKSKLDKETWSAKYLSVLHALHPDSASRDIAHHLKTGLVDSNSIKLINTLAFINNPVSVRTMAEWSQSKDSVLAAQARWWLGFRRTNDWQNLVNWSEYEALIADPELKKMNLWLDQISKSKGKVQLVAALEMAQDAAGGLALIQLLINGKLDPANRRIIQDTIFSNPNPLVRAMAGDMFWRKNNKQYSSDVIKRMETNREAGKAVFDKACITCHRFNNKGGQIGPDLSDVGQKMDMSTLLDAVIQPSAGIAFGFESYTIETKDGKTLSGFLLNDGEVIRLKDILGQVHELPATNIKKKTINKSSLMPAPQYLNLSDVDLAQVVGYLLKK